MTALDADQNAHSGRLSGGRRLLAGADLRTSLAALAGEAQIAEEMPHHSLSFAGTGAYDLLKSLISFGQH